MMEIGSFIELQFKKGMEFYTGEKNIARLNNGRAAIWHAYRILECKSIWIPYYQCETVREFLRKKGVLVKYYHIDKSFAPLDLLPEEDEAVLLVNYYGIMSSDRMKNLAQEYKNVIIDNSQAFFSKPIDKCMNVYSCRKFIGVPDGAYVIGDSAEKYVDEYEQGYSSDTSLFLLQRIEYGCEGKAYKSRLVNEERIDTEDIKKMSKLTRIILDGTDYKEIIKKRVENFRIAKKLFDSDNYINVSEYYDDFTVPMVYPMVVENDSLLENLQIAKHFQGRWWGYVCEEQPQESFEHWISRNMIPITIDQRYGEDELLYIMSILKKGRN